MNKRLLKGWLLLMGDIGFIPQRAIKINRNLSEPDLVKQMLKLGESIAKKGQLIQSVNGPYNHDDEDIQLYILDLAIIKVT